MNGSLGLEEHPTPPPTAEKGNIQLELYLKNCKNPGLITVILGYRMTPGAPEDTESCANHGNNGSKKVRNQLVLSARASHFLVHFCDVTARLRREDVNIRRRFFPLSL